MKEKCRRRSSLLLHASKLKLSILLLQLLCLPPCCVPVDAPRTAAAEVEEMEILRYRALEQEMLWGRYNLRRAGRTSWSLLGAFYSLLGMEASTAGSELAGDDRRLQSTTANKEWYVDWVSAMCVQSCDPRTTTNPNCNGIHHRENFLFATAKDCCGTMLPWKTPDTCTRVGHPDGTLNQMYQDFSTPGNNWQDLPVPGGGTPSVGNYQPPANTISANKPLSYYKPPPTKPKPAAPGKDSIIPKSTCWRSGMSCSSEAQKFACCGTCANGVCV